MPGVMVIQGMSLRIPAGGLVISIGENGSPGMAPLVPHIRLDLWPTWLEIGCKGLLHERVTGLPPLYGRSLSPV